MSLKMLAGAGGAALGAAVSVAAGVGDRRAIAAGTAVGALVGAFVALQQEKQVRTFADVAKEDAEFQQAALAAGFDGAEEAAALRRLFDGDSSRTLTEACDALNAGARLGAARDRWLPWKDVSDTALSKAIQSVVDDLEAPHLQPSGIEKRLLSGVAAASFGLFTLMNHGNFTK